MKLPPSSPDQSRDQPPGQAQAPGPPGPPGQPGQEGQEGQFRAQPLSAEELWRLSDERDFLVRSLDDARAEFEAGDLSARDYDILRRRDEQRLAALDARLAPSLSPEPLAPASELSEPSESARSREPARTEVEDRSGEPAASAPDPQSPDQEAVADPKAGPRISNGQAGRASQAGGEISPSPSGTPEGPGTPAGSEAPEGPGAPEGPPVLTGLGGVARRPANRRRRHIAIVSATTVVVVAAVVALVVHLSSPRLPGQTVSGSVVLNKDQKVAQQLADAGDFVDQGKLSSALALYSQVLTEVPHQPVALAEKGFLEWDAGYQDHQTGVMAKGRSLVAESVQVAPSAPVGHLFLGIIDLDQDKDPASSVAQMSLFLADHPPTALLDQAASVVAAAYRADGKPVPKTLPAPASSSPATSSSAGASASSPSPSTRGTSGGSSGPVGSTTGG